MRIEELEEALNERVEFFGVNMQSTIERILNHRLVPYLDVYDLEEITRQTFYAISYMKNDIIKYLKEKG